MTLARVLRTESRHKFFVSVISREGFCLLPSLPSAVGSSGRAFSDVPLDGLSQQLLFTVVKEIKGEK